MIDLKRFYEFYFKGLGFPTKRSPDQGIVFFQMDGTYLALYEREKMRDEIPNPVFHSGGAFSGITLAHNVRTKEEVDLIILKAHEFGAKIEIKPRIHFGADTVVAFLTLMDIFGKWLMGHLTSMKMGPSLLLKNFET